MNDIVNCPPLLRPQVQNDYFRMTFPYVNFLQFDYSKAFDTLKEKKYNFICI